MIANYFKIVFRILWRNKAYSLINIIGLAIGLCCSIIVFLHVSHEFSYDRFHNDSERIYRFVVKIESNGSISERPWCNFPLGETLKNEVPEVEEVVRINRESPLITFENNSLFKSEVLHVETDFFNMFSIPLLVGNPDVIFKEPNAVILSNSFAKKIFGDVEPIGKIIKPSFGVDFIVRGIAADPPSNTKFKFDIITPLAYILVS